MKEVIIFSNINQFALLRQLAKYGVNTMGYRVFNNSSILSYIREKTGNLSSKKTISNKNKAYLYSRFLKDDTSYFKGSSYEVAKNLSSTIDSIRVLITDDEEKELKNKLTNNKVFKEKYEAIYNFYKKYKEYLNTNEETDYIQDARDIITSNKKIDLEVLTIKGEDISPLEKKLLETCFKNVKEIEFRELFNVEKSKIDFKHLYRSKGYSHEISNVFKIIATEHLAIDKCTIVYTDYKNYYNSIKEYSTLFNLPVSYIDGIPSTEYNAYRMLYLITKLNDGLYGYDVLMNLIKDKSFNYDKLMQQLNVTGYLDTFLEEIGDLKFNFDPNHNDEVYSKYIVSNTSYKDEIKIFKDIFNKGVINLIEEYVINDDLTVTHALINDLNLYRSINGFDDFDFFKSLLGTKINPSVSREGSITVCSINKVKENIRENMFFVGNDSDSFHISLAENNFIADDKLEEFNKDYAKTSIKIAINKRENYKEAIQLAYDLKANVYISYTEVDESELKEHNFISLLYDLQKLAYPDLEFDKFKKAFDPVNTYFGNNFDKNEKVIEKYLDKTNLLINDNTAIEKEEKIDNLLDKRYAPTQIESNFKCRKRFLIERILGVDGEEKYDVFQKLANTDFGNMFHKVMEFANENKNDKEVLKYADIIFEMYRAKRNPVLDYELDEDKVKFMDMVKNGIEYIKTKQKGTAEDEQKPDIDINGNILHIKGFPDLISGNEIIDYKAKRKLEHKDEDEETCIQALIYALMNKDLHIDHVEYYYPYFDRPIKTTFNEKNITARLNNFINSLVNNDFKAAKDILVDKDDKDKLDDICRYCTFKDICGREK